MEHHSAMLHIHIEFFCHHGGSSMNLEHKDRERHVVGFCTGLLHSFEAVLLFAKGGSLYM